MNKKIGLILAAALSLAMVTIMLISASASTNDPAIFEKTDRFTVIKTENGLSLISQDGELVINIGNNTKIVFENGQAAKKSLVDGQTLAMLLNNRNLTVSYRITTCSIPAHTIPENIVILYETAVPLPATINDNTTIGITPPIYEFSPEEITTLFPHTDKQFSVE